MKNYDGSVDPVEETYSGLTPCQTVTGQTPKFQPIICGKEGVDLNGVVKCIGHWAASRNHANKKRFGKGPSRRDYEDWKEGK